MPSTPDRLPFPLSQRSRDTIQSIMSRSGRPLDYAIAGIPFMSAVTKDTPFMVSTADMQKQQFDTEPEPGEHTLTGWWVRSQASWHQGAGAKYQEITNQYGTAAPSFRFYDSNDINPWHPGELRLANKFTQINSSDVAVPIPDTKEVTCLSRLSENDMLVGYVGGIGHFLNPTTWVDISSNFGTDEFDQVLAVQVDMGAGSFTTAYLAVNSSNLYVVFNSDKSTKTFPLGSTTTNRWRASMVYAMDRLWVATGKDVFQVPLADLVSNPSATVLSAWWTSADPAWQITDCTATASTVYFAGVNQKGSTPGSIIKVVQDSSGAIPTLTGGVVAAVFPAGEYVQSMDCLNGSIVGVGTTLGFRVCESDDSGNLTYGPLCSNGLVTSSYSVSSVGRFFYFIGASTTAVGEVVCCVDISQPMGDGTYAFCNVHRLSTGGGVRRQRLTTCDYGVFVGYNPDGTTSLFTDETAPLAGVIDSNGGVFLQSITTTADSGWIRCGRIRFSTQEPKLFKRFGVATQPLVGSVVVDLLADGGTSRLATYNIAGESEHEEVNVPSALGPRTEVEVQLTLTSSAGQGPVVRNWRVKAMPAVKPQRIWQVPLECYDRERYRSGQEYGFKGFSQERLLALQAAEDTCDTVIWQDFRNDTPIGHQVVIDKLQYVEQVPQGTGVRGSGGIIIATLRTLD